MSTPFLNFSPGDLVKDTHVEQFIQPVQNLEEGKTWYASATGSTNAFEVTLDPAPAEYSAGMRVNYRANGAVTGDTTLNVNGLGPIPVLKEVSNQLVSGDIASGQIVSVLYDGSQFQMISTPQNSTNQVAGPIENVLVYAETRAEQPTGIVTPLSMPDFTFDPAKRYLLEMTFTATGSTATIQVALSDGDAEYVYPTATQHVRPRAHHSHSDRYRKLLPQLSGEHSIEVRAALMGAGEVRIYEVHDNLVYADFSPSEFGDYMKTHELKEFIALPGRRYLLTMTSYLAKAGWISAACYLSKPGQVRGIPYPDPTLEHLEGPQQSGVLRASKLMNDLDGAYEVKTRHARSAGTQVEIRDVT